MVKSGECFNSQNMSYTCWGIDDTKQLWNQSTVTLFNQNLFIYNPVFYLLNGPDPWKLVDLLVLYYVQYELNKRLPLVLCEIIERREGEVIIQYASKNDAFDCHCVCMKECEIPSYVAYSTFLHLNSDCWHWKWCMFFFEGVGSFLECCFGSVCLILIIFGNIFNVFAPVWSMGNLALYLYYLVIFILFEWVKNGSYQAWFTFYYIFGRVFVSFWAGNRQCYLALTTSYWCICIYYSVYITIC